MTLLSFRTPYILLLALFLLCTSQSFSVATFISKSNGNWNSPNSWTFTGISHDSIPSGEDSVFISPTSTNHTITIPRNFSAQCFALVLGSATKGNGSGVGMDDSSSLSTSSITINQPASGTRLFSIGNGSVTVDGDIILNSITTSSGRTSKISVTNGSVSVKGNIIFNASVPANATFDLSGGSSTLILGGRFIINSKGTLASGTSSTTIFNGASTQTIPLSLTSFSYNNIIVNNTGADGLLLDAPINNSNVTGTIAVHEGKLNMSSFSITGTATRTFELRNNAILVIGGANSTNGFPAGFTPIIGSKSTVVYAGGLQTIASLANGYGNLILLNKGKKTAEGPLNIKGNFYFESPFDASNYYHTIYGNWTNNAPSFLSTETIVFASPSEARIDGSSPTTFNNVEIHTPSLISLHTGIEIVGDLSITQGTFDLANSSCNRTTFGGALKIANGTTLKIGSEKGFPDQFASVALEPNSTVEFNGASQTVDNIPDGYGNLILSGNGKKTLTGKTVVKGDFTFSTDVDAKGYTETLLGNWINNGGNFHSFGSVAFTGDNNSSIKGTSQTTFYNLTVNKNAQLSLEASIAVSNLFTITSGTFDDGGITFTGGAAFRLGNNATFKTANPNLNLHFVTSSFSASSTTEYYADIPQNILALTYGDLKLSGRGKKSTLNSFSANTVSIHNQVSFDSKGYTHYIQGNWNVSGTFLSTGEIIFNGSDQTISPSNFHSVTFSGNGTKTLLGNVIINENLTIGNQATLDGGPNTITVSGNWTNKNKFFSSGIVEFSGENRSITASSFNNVSFKGKGTTRILGPLAIGGDITIASKTTVDFSDVTHIVDGNWENNGNIISRGTILFGGDAQTISSTEFYILRLSGTGIKNSNGNISTLSDFIIDNGAQFNASNFTYSIAGNFVNKGTLHEGTSTFSFNGNTVQSMNRGTYYNLSLNNPLGAEINGRVLINHSLRVLSGKLFTNNDSIELGTQAVLWESKDNIVVGKIYSFKNITAGTLESFGNIGFEMQTTAPSGPTLVVRTTGTSLHGSSAYPASMSIKRYFSVSPTINEGLNATIIVHYNNADLSNQDENTLDVWNSPLTSSRMMRVENGTKRNIYACTDTVTGINSISVVTLADANNYLSGGTITVKKFRDADGDATTTNDWLIEPWKFSIYRNSPGGTLIAQSSTPDSLLSIHDVTGGTYSVTQSDSFGWSNIAYQVNNGNVIQNGTSHIEITSEPGLTKVITFASTSRNSLILNSFWDKDGDIYSHSDRERKAWGLQLHQGSPSGTLISLNGNDSTLFATLLTDGAYYLVLADSVKWIPLAYRINSTTLIPSSQNVIPLNFSNGAISLVDVLLFHPNTIAVKNVRDPDGKISTLENLEPKPWGFTLYKDFVNSENKIASYASSPEFTIPNLGNRTYILVQDDSSTWKHEGYILNNETHISAVNNVSITLNGGDEAEISFMNFHPNTLTVQHLGDEDGIFETQNDRIQLPWNYELYHDAITPESIIAAFSGVSSITLDSLPDGTYIVHQIDSAGFPHLGYTLDGANIKDEKSKNVAISLQGGGVSSSVQFVNYIAVLKKYRSFIQDSLGKKSLSLSKKSTITQPATTRKPLVSNVRDSIFKNYLTPHFGGITLGIPQIEKNNIASFGWVKLSKSQRKFAPHTKLPLAFSHTKEAKNPIVGRINNKLAGELYALKLSIAVSDFGMSPTGLGELIFDDGNGTENPLNGKSLREIAPLDRQGMLDSVLTYGVQSVSINQDVTYQTLYNTLRNINLAFNGGVDSISTNPLVIAGTASLNSVAFLKPSLKEKLDIPVDNVDKDIPKTFFLSQNYPNPFNPTTTITYQLAVASQVTIRVFNLVGQEVATLMNQEEYPEGTYQTEFNASQLASGVYFYRLSAIPIDEEGLPIHLVRKMVLVK